ncbi:MAG: RNA-directed DNA polymerase [Acidobacteriota bacterium]
MRRIATSFDAVASPEALLRAWRAYASGKRRRPAVARFAVDAERRVLDLADALATDRYRPASPRLLPIRDPKPRLIAVAPVGDRVVQRALYDALAPAFHRSLTDDTFACLPGRGSHRALLRFLDGMRRHDHVLHLDIARYFASIDHAVLRDVLTARLRDARIVRLIDRHLEAADAFHRRAEVRALQDAPPAPGRPCGLPIGHLTSQWWANVYLSDFDHHAKRVLRVPRYIRYMDDLVLFGDERTTLRGWRREAADWLAAHRRLALNPRKGHIRSTRRAQPYLGYRVTRGGFDLGPKAARRFAKRLPALLAGDVETLERVLEAWFATTMF